MPSKTILITGVSRGLGRAMTEEFIRLGHVVIGRGRSEKEIAHLQNQFPAPNDFSAVNVADTVSARLFKTGGAGLRCRCFPPRPAICGHLAKNALD